MKQIKMFWSVHHQAVANLDAQSWQFSVVLVSMPGAAARSSVEQFASSTSAHASDVAVLFMLDGHKLWVLVLVYVLEH
jgi:hypothetical protein